MTYDEWLIEVTKEFNKNSNLNEQVENAIRYWHQKGYLNDMFYQGFPPHEVYREMKDEPFYS